MGGVGAMVIGAYDTAGDRDNLSQKSLIYAELCVLWCRGVWQYAQRGAIGDGKLIDL